MKNINKYFPLISITLVFVISLFISEMILMILSEKDNKKNITRQIQLREGMLNSINYYKLPNKELRYVSNIENKAYRVEIDSSGFIFPSQVHKSPDTRIIFYGGSTTECLYVDEKERFPYLVGLQLSSLGEKVNAYNGGHSGNHSLHSINRLLNDGIRHNPDIVVMKHNINDLITLIYEVSYWNLGKRGLLISKEMRPQNYKHATFKNFIHRMIPNLYYRLYVLKMRLFKNELFEDDFADINTEKISFNAQALKSQFSKNLKMFIEICKINKIIPVLMTQANRFLPTPDKKVLEKFETNRFMNKVSYTDFKSMIDIFNHEIRQVSKASGVMCIDLDSIVPKDSLYLYDLVHYNKEGNRFISKVISDSLKKVTLEIQY